MKKLVKNPKIFETRNPDFGLPKGDPKPGFLGPVWGRGAAAVQTRSDSRTRGWAPVDSMDFLRIFSVFSTFFEKSSKSVTGRLGVFEGGRGSRSCRTGPKPRAGQ